MVEKEVIVVANWLHEIAMRLRIKPKSDPTSQISKKGDSLVDFIESLEGSNVVDISELNKFRTLSDDRNYIYKMYDEMAKDSIIATALEMYTDDATQYNNKGKVIWAESDDKNIAEFCNRLIDIFNLNKDAWSHIYQLIKYGDLYFELFKDDEDSNDPLLYKRTTIANDTKILKHKVGSQLEEYIEVVPNPAELFDLNKRGKTVGFIKIPTNEIDSNESGTVFNYTLEGLETEILPPDKYVHISLAHNTSRFPEKLNISLRKDDSSDPKKYTYYINRGKSILHDTFKIYKELQLMEDSLLLNRITRSSIIRLLQIEVGDMPKTQARELLKRIKQLVEQKNYMDKGEGTYDSMTAPGPVDNVIYVPTHNGKGTITSANLGGDVDVKSITDIDYYRQKQSGSLKIPMAYLYGTAFENSLGGGTSLAKMDSRYGRTVKRIQNAYISGITTLINLFALSKGLDNYINNFTVKMNAPSTIEDIEKDEMLSNKIIMISDIMDLLSEDWIATKESKKEILIYLINTIANEPDISSILEKDKKAKIEDQMEENENADNSDDDFGGGRGIDFGSRGTDFGSDDSDMEFDDEEDLELNDEIDTEENPDFGDFSDEAI